MPRYESKRRQIEEAAVELFAEHGVDSVSLRDIGMVCGITGPGVHAHFGSKDALVAMLFARGFADYAARLAAAAALSGTFREKLGAVIAAVLRLHDEDHARFRFLLLRQHDHLANIPADAANPVEVIRQLIDAGISEGAIPRRDPDLATLAVIGLVVQPATGRLYGRLDGRLVPLAAEIAAMAWGALNTVADTPPHPNPSRKPRSRRP